MSLCYKFQNIKLLTDNTSEKPTKNNIINNFTNLLINANSGDVVFFSYSQAIKDISSKKEKDFISKVLVNNKVNKGLSQ